MTKLCNSNKTKRCHRATKRRSHKTRSQRGGLFGYFENNTSVATGLPDSPSYWSKAKSWFTGSSNSGTNVVTEGMNKLDTGIGNVATTLTGEASKLTGDATNKVFEITGNAKEYILGTGSDTNNTLIGSPLPTPDPTPPSPVYGTGGKSRKHKHKKGGANLGLLYYATPVNSMPIKGGKKHKYTCCKNKRKSKRHRHNASCLQNK